MAIAFSPAHNFFAIDDATSRIAPPRTGRSRSRLSAAAVQHPFKTSDLGPCALWFAIMRTGSEGFRETRRMPQRRPRGLSSHRTEKRRLPKSRFFCRRRIRRVFPIRSQPIRRFRSDCVERAIPSRTTARRPLRSKTSGQGCGPFSLVMRLGREQPSNRGSRASACFRGSI